MAVRLKVREVAELKGFSQRRLYLRSGVDINIIRRIYRDPTSNITLETLGKLAKVLEVDVSELVENAPEE